MSRSILRLICALMIALATVWMPRLSLAQQQTAPAAPQTQEGASQSGTASPSKAFPSSPVQSVAADAAASDGSSRPLRSTAVTLRELSPWSMFLSADVVVKAVIVGLALASLMTWTIFIAKMIELSRVRRRLRHALTLIKDARSVAEAQFALGASRTVLSSLLAAAIREARSSAGISSDAGIKERASSSFAEIARAEARRIRLGMGLLATIGATSPFIGLFGTVWGIMNSFIGISKSQTTNLAVVAPGIAEALLATAIGLAAAIPAVIIYNHFARVTKGYLELVGRASGAAGRLLSRDLERTHVSSRAAE